MQLGRRQCRQRGSRLAPSAPGHSSTPCCVAQMRFKGQTPRAAGSRNALSSTRRVQALPSAVFVLGARRSGRRARRRGRARRRSCWCSCRRALALALALALAPRAWPSRARPCRAQPPRARPTHLERGHLGQPRLAERDRKDGGRPAGRQPLAPVVRRAAHVSGNRRSSSSAGRPLTVRSSEGMSSSLASPTAASSGSAPRRRPSRRSPLGSRADRGGRASRPASSSP